MRKEAGTKPYCPEGSRYCGVPKEEITYTCGGINHMDWFLRLEHKGRDLYPALREVFERPEYYKNEKVRGEVFRHYMARTPGFTDRDHTIETIAERLEEAPAEAEALRGRDRDRGPRR